MFLLGTWSVQGKPKAVTQCTIHRENFQTKRPLLASLREDKFLAGLFSAFEKREREFLLTGVTKGREAKSGQSTRRRHTHLTALQLSERTRCLPTKGVKKADSATPAEKTPELEHTVCNGTRALVMGREGL